MNILNVVILIFLLFEVLNILIMYFKPEFKYGNSMATFKAWEEAKKDEKTELFAKYMAYWVAGSKAVFIALLIVILLVADNTTKLWATIILIPAISLYYVRLHPIIKKLDAMGEIKPKGYSKMLGIMIAFFILMFAIAAVIFVIV